MSNNEKQTTASAHSCAADDSDRLVIRDEVILALDPTKVAKLSSKKKTVLHILHGSIHRTVEVYEEDFLHNHLQMSMDYLTPEPDPYEGERDNNFVELGTDNRPRPESDYNDDIAKLYSNDHRDMWWSFLRQSNGFPVNYGGTFDPKTLRMIGGKWAIGLWCGPEQYIYDNIYKNQYGIFVAEKDGILGVLEKKYGGNKLRLDWLPCDAIFVPCAAPDIVYEVCDKVLITRAHFNMVCELRDKWWYEYACLDSAGHIISDFYDHIYTVSPNGYIRVERREEAKVLHGYIDSKTGKEVIPTIYNQTKDFEAAGVDKQGRSHVCRALVQTFNEEWFYIDEQGIRLPDPVDMNDVDDGMPF